MLTVEIQAPAKLNLGLEVISRRPDGFHEIVTIFQAIAVYDTLTFTPADAITITCAEPGLAGDDNLISTALTLLRQEFGAGQGAEVSLSKQIPVAAGLGGASTDAAAALIAGRRLWRASISDARLRQLARQLGSDVPFFFDAGTALGTGQGNDITVLPPLTNVWFVVVSPRIRIPRKTPTLYDALDPADFSDGTAVRGFAAQLSAGELGADAGLPPNAFARPLYALYPDLVTLPASLAAAGATTVGLSGAGPSHFGLFHDPDQAAAVAARLRSSLAATAEIRLATPVIKPPTPVSTYHG